MSISIDIIALFRTISLNLIPIMFSVLCLALFLRYLAYRSGKMNQGYFNAFSRTLQKILEDESTTSEPIYDIDRWLSQVLDKVAHHLPNRSFRFMGKVRKQKEESIADRMLNKKDEALKTYVEGKKLTIASVKQQVDAFRSPHPPDFHEITRRVLDQDMGWRKIARILPVDALSRSFDILPGLFVVGGIFGTFIGITSALPKIASIDLNKIHEAAPILNSFVTDLSFSMNASITGIVCSVVMTILIALFPLDTVRDDVMRNMDQSFEFMWYQIHASRMSRAEKAMIQELQLIREALVEKGGGGRPTDHQKDLKKTS
ncbi:MAG: hypothetical protein HQK54_08190 [Oligoflexales bacterium]|nr:hypothetical protein [Oligoflexales bacterium]